MNRESPLDATFALDLENALAADEFYLVYQPEIDLHTNGFAGVEVLIRWRHATRGVVNPDQFIPLLEASGAIVSVGRWALETACYQGAEWHAKGYRFAVAVNTSSQQLRDPNFVTDVNRVLRASRLDPAHLTLEFSYAALEDSTVQENLSRIHDRGVRLAIDDFAPGRPDWSALATLPIDIVKLERAFVAENSPTNGASLIQQVVRDARALNLRVMASGVEDASQLDQLRHEQVDVGQGFHFARPYEVAEIDRFLEDFALFSGRPL
ncbi:MAG: EAL domain-containing protein [Acidimicrobiaceae bacterium]|nr:EAL domain-containing protein [Acidimicrobiaceae bacterium]